MALSELAALDAAYQILQPLDEASRRRALQWLSDALGQDKPLTNAPANPAAAPPADAAPPTPAPAMAARPRRRAAQTGTGKRTVTKTAKKTPPRRRTQKVETTHTGTRTYRRMPVANEVLAAYRQTGTITGLAEHFDVPLHTVYSWARRLRSQGHQIGR